MLRLEMGIVANELSGTGAGQTRANSKRRRNDTDPTILIIETQTFFPGGKLYW